MIIKVAGYATNISTFGISRGTNVVISQKNSKSNNRLTSPIVFFNNSEQSLSIDFGFFTFESISITISSPYTDVDYVVNSSFVTIPLEVDGVSDYQIVIETNDGDIFEGTLFADDYQR
ncbi:MAG: hypothetical protein ACI307_00740 [Sodaliphilus sp.]